MTRGAAATALPLRGAPAWPAARAARGRPLDAAQAWSAVIVALACATTAQATGGIRWALLPLAACGLVEAPTVIRWLRGEHDPLDPKALLGLLMLHNTFVAPLLHLAWDWYTPAVRVPADPWPWFGRLALVNLAALLSFEGACRLAEARRSRGGTRVIARPRLAVALTASGLVALVAQALLYVRFGGLRGIVALHEAGGQDFAGTGWLQMLAWPFFLVLLLAWITFGWPRRHERPPSTAALVALLVLFSVGHFVWVGLQGSRSSTLAGLLLAAAYCHFLVRRLTVRWFLAGALAALVFAFTYGFYKSAGRAGTLAALEGRAALAHAQRQTGRDLPMLLLADLARADIQMEVLWTIAEGNPDYVPKRGATYLGAAVFIPRALWPSRPFGPQEAYAELTRGRVAVRQGERPGSRVFGLTGETLLNFGWLGVPLAHALLGTLVGKARRALRTAGAADARLLVAPLLVLLLTSAYLADLANVVYLFFRDGALLSACAFAASVRSTPGRARCA